MANIEKHPKHLVEQVAQADFSAVPTCARASHLVGQYIKNRLNEGHRPTSAAGRGPSVIIRMDAVPATPGNVGRIRERIRLLNRRLQDAGVPFRLRVV